MTRDEYWELVHKVNWPHLCDSFDRPYNAGKRILVSLLPTLEAAEEFQNIHAEVRSELVEAMDAWAEENAVNGWGTGDDGFSDLTNHIVGCGKDEWLRTIVDPSLAMVRANLRWTRNSTAKRSDSYVESFSYCIPYEDEYAPLEEKLASAVSGLNHWIDQAAQENPPDYAESEVERRIVEVAELEAQIIMETGEKFDNTANVRERIQARKLEIAKHKLAKLLDDRLKLEVKIKEAQEALDSLQ